MILIKKKVKYILLNYGVYIFVMNNTTVSQTEDKANKDKAEKQREYYKKNADKLREYARNYRKNNADKIRKQANVKYTCVCEVVNMVRHKKRHEQYKKHLAFIKK